MTRFVTEAAGVVAVLIWLYLLFGRGFFWRMRAAKLAAGAPARRIAVVIPARNEAAAIGGAIASIVRQQYAGEVRLFLVDDHSEDGTAEAARKAAPSGKLQVLAATPLPEGWTGKLWAVAEGVRAAEKFRADYYWLTDADIIHDAGALDQLVRQAETDGRDLVSMMVKLRCETLAERTLIPAFVFFFLKLYPPAWIADDRRATAGAAGGSMLLRRTALERIGGIQTIRSELIDDCALAKAVKRTGGRVWLGLTSEAHSVREYCTFSEIGRMISRTAFTQLRYSGWLLAGTAFGMFAMYLLPLLLLLTRDSAGVALGSLAWLLMSAAYTPAVRFYRRSLLWAPALPLVALFYTCATIYSAVCYWRGRGGSWKGRTQAAHG